MPVVPRRVFEKLEDVSEPAMRDKIRRIQETIEFETVQRCYDALVRKNGHVQDAISWLFEDEEQDAPGEEDDVDELASATPITKRGVALPSYTQSSQPVRPAAKQEVKAPTLTIAEKYGSTQAARKPSLASPDDEAVKLPRRRLQQGRKTRSPTPPSPVQKPPQPLQRLKRPAEIIAIRGDDDGDVSEADSSLGEEVVPENCHDQRLLNFFNTCSIQDLTDLSTQPEDVVKFVLDKRPFESLDVIRVISNATETKSGKKSRSRPVGDKMVDICSHVFMGYDAIDELVDECERIGKPIQDALKGWGASSFKDGELHLLNLDDAQDSGIGTPSSTSEDIPVPTGPKSKGRFLSQPESMNSETTLKNYQLVGLNWLNLLYTKKLSCILADEMGLGKTCQVIAFLAHLKQQHMEGVHLVIVPGSTLENWLREFKLFAPTLEVRPYYGSMDERRDLQDRIWAERDDIDVVVTTYDMAVKPEDNKFLRKYVNPHVCIYDEAHQLRNSQSDRYKQLTRIPSRFRVLLTGTPLQNNLQELVAILAFIMPDLFQEKREQLQYIFQHKASTKDEDHAALLSTQRIARARSMMTPFILRRKKVQVLELPKKLNRLEYCDMTASQRRYYAELVDEAQQFFAQKANGKKASTKASAKASSNVLMSLRKAAIHPLLARRIFSDSKIDKIVTLLLKNPEFAANTAERTKEYLIGEHHQSFKGGDYGLHRFCKERPYLQKFALKQNEWMDAGKIEVFRKLVSEYAANGDRVLVFSQFTTMMDILEAVLETMSIRFLRLDGNTNMQIRQTMIDQFGDDESITLFMLSTKAGGAGINLAAANKVIIFDSGFNPQDDIQAENRAHRVGQTRDVEVVRLVTRGTIEEQIHALGESKIALDERVAGEGATAAEERQAEKAGEQIVEKLFLENLQKEEDIKQEDVKQEVPYSEAPTSELDLKDMFKSGLEGAGLKVASKQAQY
jgi:SWI/SNF-related matrix-associated actin-dependent regulator 1 of chromatin subfamily A